MIRACVFAGVVVLAPVAAMADILVTTEEYPPFNMTQNGKVTGIATELVKSMFEKAGVAYKIEVLPWNRAYQTAQTQKDACVYSTTETPERKDLFQWVGPLLSNDWVLFAKADNATPLKSLDDTRGKVIGGYAGDAVAVYLEKGGYKVDAAPRDELNIPKLAAGRIDYWASGSELGPYLAKTQGAADLIKPVLTFNKTVMSLACNKDTDPAALAKLRAALEGLRK
jgi:polar amino acid transport system substrate-binding protein